HQPEPVAPVVRYADLRQSRQGSKFPAEASKSVTWKVVYENQNVVAGLRGGGRAAESGFTHCRYPERPRLDASIHGGRDFSRCEPGCLGRGCQGGDLRQDTFVVRGGGAGRRG